MTDATTLETKSPVALAFERLTTANAALTAAEQAQTRATRAVGEAQNEVMYAQRAYNAELNRSRTIDAMRKA